MSCSISKYRIFLLNLAQELTEEDFHGMKFLAAEFLPRSKRDCLTGVLEFFCELEEQHRLGADNLGILKFMLLQLKRLMLVKKVEEFELEQKVYRASLKEVNVAAKRQALQDDNNNKRCCRKYNSSTSCCSIQNTELAATSTHGTNSTEETSCTPDTDARSRQPGELTARCVIELAAKGAWYLGCGYILNRYKEDPDALAHLVSTVVLPTGILMKTLSKGSIRIVFQATDLDALRELWRRYKQGVLRDALQGVLVMEGLRQLAGGSTIIFRVDMDEQEYRDASLELMAAQCKADTLWSSINSPYSRRLACSLPDMTSMGLHPARDTPRDIHVALCTDLRNSNARLWNELTRARGTGSSSTSEAAQMVDSAVQSIANPSDETATLLREFLVTSASQELSATLDREMAFGNDWRQLASEFRFKMSHIRRWERQSSPSKALLESVVSKRPGTTTDELIDKLSAIDRIDAVMVIEQFSAQNQMLDTTLLLVDLPFNIRRDLALDLDAHPENFTRLVHQYYEKLNPIYIACLQKRSSPTMAFLDQLESKMPRLTVKSLCDMCDRSGSASSAEMLDQYLMSKGVVVPPGVRTGRRSSVTNRLQWAKQSKLAAFGARTGSRDSGLSESSEQPPSP